MINYFSMAVFRGLHMDYKFKPSDFVKLEVLTDKEWRTIYCPYSQVASRLFKFHRESNVKGSRVSLGNLSD